MSASPAELNLNLGAPVVKFVRLRYVDDKPFDIATNYLPAQLFPGLEREDLTTASLYALMQSKYGIRLDHGVRLAEAAPCSPEEAKLLRIKTTVPLLVIQSTMYDVDRSASGVWRRQAARRSRASGDRRRRSKVTPHPLLGEK